MDPHHASAYERGLSFPFKALSLTGVPPSGLTEDVGCHRLDFINAYDA